jgi:hypothetical protein
MKKIPSKPATPQTQPIDPMLTEAVAIATKSSLYVAELCQKIEKRLGQTNQETMQAVREVLEANKPKARVLNITVTSKDSRDNTTTRHYKINVE